jgi:ABC-type multidrug transport system fused ATPase/permease subunit
LPIINRVQGLILQLFAEYPMAMRALDVHPLVIANNKTLQARETNNVVAHSEMESEVLLRLNKVSFTYPGNEAFGIADVNLEIKRGLRYAIVGPSGSGKTTIADICLGIIVPESGSIVWSSDVEANVGYVPQDTYIGLSSLMGNVAIEWSDGVVDMTRAQSVLQQAQLNAADLAVSSTDSPDPQKLQMSGGQRQRIGLARALYRQPDFLVLDEATSALDSETEFEVIQAVRALPRTTTVLTIAHRLSTIRDADEVIYMEKGRVIGSGTFSDLTENLPEFARQVELAMRHNDLID